MESLLPTLPVNKGNWAARKGYDFHLTLLMLFFLRSVKTGKHHLRFSAEVEGVGAWDDILVEDKSQVKKWNLFQAKHHEKIDGNEKKISYQVLTAMKGDYSLPKYFLSFLEAQATAANHGAQIENVVICTTSDFEGIQDRFGTVSVEKNRDINIQFQLIPNGTGQLWRELLSMKTETYFYGITEKELWPILNITEVKNEIQKKKILCQDVQSGEINRDDFPTKVTEFSEKLIFATQMPKLESFTEAVKQELKEKVIQDNIETFFSNFFIRFQKWVVEKLPNPIDATSFQGMVEDVAIENQLTELYLKSRKKHKASEIRFRDVSTLKNFIDGDKNKLKILFQNSKLVTYQLCQAMEAQQLRYVEIAFSDLTRTHSDILKYLHLKSTEFKLVIDCNDNTDLAELMRFKSKKNTLFLFQDSLQHSILKQEFRSEFEIFYSNQIIKFSEFMPESQDFILKRNVKFQSKKMRLGDILSSVSVSYDFFTESFLEQLFLSEEQIEVGVPLPNIQETESYYIPRQVLPKLKLFEGTCAQWNEKSSIEFNDCCSQCIVLAADPGMGKSTFLQHTAHEMKQLNPQHLVIYINLTDHTRLLSKMNEDPNPEDIIKFLHSALVTKNSSIVSSYLTPWLSQCQNKTVVLLDSFDEIAPTYSEKVISIIKYITHNPPHLLYVTTRYHTQKQLEETLKFPVYTLREFTEDDQTTFLKRYWKTQLNLSDNDFNDDRFPSFTNNLFWFLDRVINDWETDFMGIPLQTRMMAEAFKDSFREWIMGTDVTLNPIHSPFSGQYNIYCLYKDFLKKKIDILCAEKQRIDCTIPAVAEEMKPSWSEFERVATELAINTTFDEDDLEAIKDLERHLKEVAGIKQNFNENRLGLVRFEENKIKQKLGDNSMNSKDTFDEVSSVLTGRDGVVVVTPDREYRFIHCTFAEYFAGSHLGKLMKHIHGSSLPDSFQILFTKLHEDDSYEVVRLFMDYELCKDLPLHCAVLGDNIKATRQLMQQHSHDTDSLNRSALQLAIYWERHDLICLLLKIPQLVNVFDKMNQSPLSQILRNIERHYGTEQYFYLYLLAKAQLRMNATEIDSRVLTNKIPEDKKPWQLLKDMTNGLVLCLKNHLNQKQLQKFQDLEATIRKVFYSGCSGDLILSLQPILYPAKTLEYNFTCNKKLCDEEDVVVFDLVACGDLPLHQAVIRGDVDACHRLLQQGKEVNAVDALHRTPLHLAAYYYDDSSEAIGMLYESGANLDATDVFGETPVVVTAICNHWECAAFMLSWGASTQALDQLTNINWDDGLYLAAKYGYEQLVALCLAKQANPNQQDSVGWTPLHWLALLGRVGSVELLLKAGAKTNITDSQGKTPEERMILNEYLSPDKQRIQNLLHQYEQPKTTSSTHCS